MRLVLTVVAGAVTRDVTIDAPADARTREVSRALARTSIEASETAPVLYLAGGPLDPEQLVRQGPLRHGSIVGLGQPVAPAPWVDGTVAGCWEVRIESGPGAGLVCRLAPGEYLLGPGPGCAVRVPRATQTLTLVVRRDGVEVTADRSSLARGSAATPLRPVLVDDGAHAGVPVTSVEPAPEVHLDRAALSGLTRWPPGRALVFGPVLLGLARARVDDHGPVPDPAGATVRHHRPPRLRPPPRTERFALPSAPAEPEPTPWPWLMLLVPLAIGGGLFWLTHAWQTLLLLAVSPLLGLGGAAGARRATGRRHRRELAAYATESARVRRAALAAVRVETATRRASCPDPATLVDLAVRGGARLWERRPDDPDAFVVRVGTGELSTAVSLGAADGSDGRWLVPDLPVTLDLAAVGVLGIAGPDRHRLAEWLCGQLACLHAPGDLRLAALVTDVRPSSTWSSWSSWLPWLPHAGPDEPAPATLDLPGLRALLARRAAAGGDDPTQVVLLADGPVPDDVLDRAPGLGVAVVCLAALERGLPRGCRAVLGRDGPGTLVLRRHGEADVGAIRPDLVAPGWMPAVARALAPVRDAGPDTAGPPTACTLLEASGLVPDADAIGARWCERRTAAVIGVGADRRPVTLDLARDGPHALVAGTTGSGKSELLQTLVVSLAATMPPDRLSFVLIDYKGGAAFAGCAALPHTVGTASDLDAHLTARALASLSAEVRRRETVLAHCGARDLEEHERLRDGAPALPRLVIVVDEFATLAADLPDFVTGLVDIARRGRSLGLHLVLATQRPAGVVTADIRANTSLRIALRVTDPGDSVDVVDTAGAARISDSAPGRALLRRGPESPHLFQAARVTAPAAGGREVLVGPFGPVPVPAATVTSDPSVTTELELLVAAITRATRDAGVTAPTAPWLAPLPPRVDLDDLARDLPDARPDGDHTRIPFGLLDQPDRQRRAPAYVDLAAGRHLAVVGAPGSGRTSLLLTLAGAVARWTDPADVHVYAVDCGSGGLLQLAGLPHVGVVVARDQTLRMERLLERLAALVRERADRLAGAGHPDVQTQRAVTPAARLPWVLVLLDRWEGFCQVYDDLDGGRLVHAWQHLLQEAAAVGITVVMTGDRSLAIGRMCTLFDDTLMLRTTDPGDLAAVGVPRSRAPTTQPTGRGFCSPAGTECQVAMVGELDGRRWRDDVAEHARAFRLDDLPDSIGRDEVADRGASGLLLAVGGDRLTGRRLTPAVHGPGFLVAGPRRSGRSAALVALAAAALDRGWDVLAIAPRASPLTSCAGVRLLGADEPALVLPGLRPDGCLVLVDDLDLLDPDSATSQALSAHLARIRDHDSLLAAAGTPADLAALYRGPAVALRRGGSGLLLAPRSTADADLLGVRLPRSTLAARTPPGRGHLVHDGLSEPVQVVLSSGLSSGRLSPR